MKRAVGFAILAALFIDCTVYGGMGPECRTLTLQEQAQLAISDNSEAAQLAIAGLRAAGPAGLEAAVNEFQPLIDQHVSSNILRIPVISNAESPEKSGAAQPDWSRLKTALDSVGGQYDCYTSRLYWYTDFEAARTAAKESGKPILSLRLLGKLTDQYSCANSRFFRTTLYANSDVSHVLRDRFILHWQTVRPVPKVTIDFGDGRKLERTITGNSIHYILDSEGRPIDALPGVYGPQAFLRGLTAAETAIVAMNSMDDGQRVDRLREYHRSKANEIAAQWQNDLQQLGLLKNTSATQSARPQLAQAVAANNLAISKEKVERPLVAAALADAAALSAVTDDDAWGHIAQLHAADARLDAASISLIQAQNPAAGKAMPLAASKAVVETPLLRLVRTFQNTISIDSVRNEYTFHRQIHEWFAGGQMPIGTDVNQLNEAVYAQLFLTPSSDPWLGLVTGDVYTALENNGVCQSN